jgi:hypothetical protein
MMASAHDPATKERKAQKLTGVRPESRAKNGEESEALRIGL